MRIEAGTMACESVRDSAALWTVAVSFDLLDQKETCDLTYMLRKMPDMASTMRKETKRKKKKLPGSRLRFVMK